MKNTPSTPPSPRSPRARVARARVGWTDIVVAVLVAAVAAFVTRDAWLDILHIADRDPEASQVYLAPVVAVWLVWVRRARLRHYTAGRTWVGPALIVVGWAMYVLGDQHMYQAMWHMGALVVVVGCAASVLGGDLLYRVMPALGALCFLVPIPGRIRQLIALPLQSATARVTEMTLDTIGVAVERSGSVLLINEQEVLIAEACNGLRMVFALVMVSYAFAYGTPLRSPIRVLVVLLSPLTAIVVNVVRLVPVVWGFGYLPAGIAETIHELSGWVMLPVAFLMLLGVMRLLRWAQVPISPYILAHGS